MFIVIYEFKVKEGQEEMLVQSWENLTRLIAQHCNSLGSRLHKESNQQYLAYAQWPDETTWKNSSTLLPEESKKHSLDMKNSCESINTIHTMQVVSDMLQ